MTRFSPHASYCYAFFFRSGRLIIFISTIFYNPHQRRAVCTSTTDRWSHRSLRNDGEKLGGNPVLQTLFPLFLLSNFLLVARIDRHSPYFRSPSRTDTNICPSKCAQDMCAQTKLQKTHPQLVHTIMTHTHKSTSICARILQASLISNWKVSLFGKIYLVFHAMHFHEMFEDFYYTQWKTEQASNLSLSLLESCRLGRAWRYK